MSMTLDEGRVGELAGQVSGLVVSPHDAGYDEARAVHNGLVDRRPALIVRCRTTADVVAALEFARSAGLEVSVRGGGHNVAGRAVTGGAISTTGIAGLTLGGGLGWLMGKHGLAADNLLAVELVTAAGEVLEVDAGSHPDLFWALRGGGGNFGVVTSFTYRLHPVGMVTGGLIAHPFEAAPELLRFYRDAVADVSDELTVFAGLVHAPDGSGAKLAALVICHAGEPDAAERELAPFMAFGSPLMTQVGPLPYPVMNTLLDAGYPKGALNYWLSSFTHGLPNALIDTAVERFAAVPSPMSAILLEHFHGAVTRVGPSETAVPHREAGWNLLIPSVWTDPAGTDANIHWTRETFADLQPHLETRRWLNYLGDDQGLDAIRAAYGPNYDRLRDVKRRYDPDNVFHLKIGRAHV